MVVPAQVVVIMRVQDIAVLTTPPSNISLLGAAVVPAQVAVIMLVLVIVALISNIWHLLIREFSRTPLNPFLY